MFASKEGALDLTPFIASPPTVSSFHLGQHWLPIGGGDWLGWPTSPPYAVVATPVRAGVAEDPPVVKKEEGVYL